VVRSAEDTPGCGVPGSQIRFEIGGHASDTRVIWAPGFHGLDFIVDESATGFPTGSPPASPAPSSPKGFSAGASSSSMVSPAAFPSTGGSQHQRWPVTMVLSAAATLIVTSAAAFLNARGRV
jgi:hypothetical protein